LGECLNNGAANATTGVVETVSRVLTRGSEQILCGAASVVNAAWARCGEYAAAMQATVDSTMNNVANYKQVAGDFYQDIKDLPGGVQAQIVCEMVSTGSSGIAVSFMTTGTGAPAAWARFAEVVNKVSNMPGMTKSADVLKAMAKKFELIGKEKAAALAKAKALPTDLKESLARIERDNKDFAENGEKLEKVSRELDLKRQEVDDNPSRYAAENMLFHAESRSGSIFRTGMSSAVEDREIAKFFLKYAKLTDVEKDLATKVVNSTSTGFKKHDKDSDMLKLAKLVRDKRISTRLEVRDDFEYASPQHFAKIATEQGELTYAHTQALKAYNKSREKISDEITQYWNLIERKKLSVEEKDLYRAQVSAYMTVVICNGAGGAIDSGIMQRNDSVQ